MSFACVGIENGKYLNIKILNDALSDKLRIQIIRRVKKKLNILSTFKRYYVRLTMTLTINVKTTERIVGLIRLSERFNV